MFQKEIFETIEPEWGSKWQWKQFALLLLASITSSVPFYLHMFAAFVPEHRCFVVGCDGNEGPSDFITFAIPADDKQVANKAFKVKY